MQNNNKWEADQCNKYLGCWHCPKCEECEDSDIIKRKESKKKTKMRRNEGK